MIYYSYISCEDNYSSQHSAALVLKDRLFNILGLSGEIFKDDSGRPHIKGERADISFTHSKNLAMCAVCCDKDINTEGSDIFKFAVIAEKIGIDAEYMDPYADIARLKKISSRYLGASIDTADEFYLKWTRREAYGKLCGEGIFFKTDDNGCIYKSFIITAGGEKYQLTVAAK